MSQWIPGTLRERTTCGMIWMWIRSTKPVANSRGHSFVAAVNKKKYLLGWPIQINILRSHIINVNYGPVLWNVTNMELCARKATITVFKHLSLWLSIFFHFHLFLSSLTQDEIMWGGSCGTGLVLDFNFKALHISQHSRPTTTAAAAAAAKSLR